MSRAPKRGQGRAPRASVKDRPGRWHLLLRRQRRLVRPALGLGFAAMVVLLLAALVEQGASSGVLGSLHARIAGWGAGAGLTVRHIEIKDRANTPPGALARALGVHIGEPMLGFSVAAARKRIEALAWVDHATVERRLPDTVVVQLQERRPFAIWQHDGKFVLIDRKGQVVAGQDVAAFGDLPLVVGAGAPEAAAHLLDALTARPALAAHVLAAVRVGQRRWNLLMKNRTHVLLPEGHVDAALDRLMALDQAHQLLERPLLAIDMRLPDRLVLRPRPAPQPDGTQTGRAPAGAPAPGRKPA
ncbi:MAG: cell division protein FtsQ/DivIB [Rhodospirillales bacterium]|nr:cell division protein FtsQ/DivIB [Rhodospirillales bacterium]